MERLIDVPKNTKLVKGVAEFQTQTLTLLVTLA